MLLVCASCILVKVPHSSPGAVPSGRDWVSEWSRSTGSMFSQLYVCFAVVWRGSRDYVELSRLVAVGKCKPMTSCHEVNSTICVQLSEVHSSPSQPATRLEALRIGKMTLVFSIKHSMLYTRLYPQYRVFYTITDLASNIYNLPRSQRGKCKMF
jgi:hypothetical protein